MPAALARAQHDHSQNLVPNYTDEGEISYYTCGMHPSVTKCPICFMPLTPVKKGVMDTVGFDEDVISKVIIKLGELKLAGVTTEIAQKRQLFKEIRAVGRVAYDPEMAIAQDEFISGIKAYEKSKSGSVQEIVDRAASMVDASKRKLFLLGLSEEQIIELEKSKKVQTSLILPGEKMWIYGDIYEFELPWVKKGSYIKAKPIGLVGEEFYGKIVSINPVIDPRTRSVRFRALIDNPGSKLKPEMYVDVQIMSQYTDPRGNNEVLAIPKSALLDTGRRQIVWVDKGNGQFEGRSVEIGPESISHAENLQKFYPVFKGIKEGEKVVTKGNYLIDSQSQITGVAASSFGGALEPVKSKGPEGHAH
jgi:Cu(I)/Ag(I) efflux system membrane fusion protein